MRIGATTESSTNDRLRIQAVFCFMPYSDYLRSDHWQATKRKYFEFFPRECAFCKATKNIHLHHRRYTREYGNILGIEAMQDLIALCGSCHSQWHAIHGHYYMHRYMEAT